VRAHRTSFPGRHSQRRVSENHEYHAEKQISDLGCRQQEPELQRDIGGGLRRGQEVIVEPVADAEFRQRDEHSGQADPAQQKDHGYGERNRPGIGVDPQHDVAEHVADGLNDEHLAALDKPPLRRFGRQRKRARSVVVDCQCCATHSPRPGLGAGSYRAKV